MKTEHWLLAYVSSGILIFIIWELYIWLFTTKDTLSRYVIREQKRSRLWYIAAWGFCILLLATAVWLPFHWELL